MRTFLRLAGLLTVNALTCLTALADSSESDRLFAELLNHPENREACMRSYLSTSAAIDHFLETRSFEQLDLLRESGVLETLIGKSTSPQFSRAVFRKRLIGFPVESLAIWEAFLFRTELIRLSQLTGTERNRSIQKAVELIDDFRKSAQPLSLPTSKALLYATSRLFRASHIKNVGEWEDASEFLNSLLDLYFSKRVCVELFAKELFADLIAHSLRELSFLHEMAEIFQTSRMDNAIRHFEFRFAELALKASLGPDDMRRIRDISDLSLYEWAEVHRVYRQSLNPAISKRGPFEVRFSPASAYYHFQVNIIAQRTLNGTIRYEIPAAILTQVSLKRKAGSTAGFENDLAKTLGPGSWYVYPSLNSRIARFFSNSSRHPLVNNSTGSAEIWDEPFSNKPRITIRPGDLSSLPEQALVEEVIKFVTRKMSGCGDKLRKL